MATNSTVFRGRLSFRASYYTTAATPGERRTAYSGARQPELATRPEPDIARYVNAHLSQYGATAEGEFWTVGIFTGAEAVDVQAKARDVLEQLSSQWLISEAALETTPTVQFDVLAPFVEESLGRFKRMSDAQSKELVYHHQKSPMYSQPRDILEPLLLAVHRGTVPHDLHLTEETEAAVQAVLKAEHPDLHQAYRQAKYGRNA